MSAKLPWSPTRYPVGLAAFGCNGITFSASGMARYPWYAWHKAMVTVQVQLPEEAFSALRRSPDEMAGDLRLAAAVHWYSRGLMSQERAAQVAGLDRTHFILALAREGVDAFAVDMTSLRRELADG